MTARRLLFPLVLAVLAFALVACERTTTVRTLDYTDFDFIEDFDEVFNRREGTYLVYVYSLSCANCGTLKPEILAFAEAYDDRVLFFFNADNATAELRTAYMAVLGKSKVETPTLLLITDNSFDKNASSRYYFAGVTAIRGILNDLQNGSYQYWQ